MPLSLVTTLAEADRQQCDIEFIQVTKDRLFTADGCLIKVWKTEDLQPAGELDAQQSGITCLAAHGNRLYAGTSGGNIVIFDIETGVVIKELNKHEGSVLTLRLLGDILYSGDEEGKVFVWKNDELTYQYETIEEVWDFIPTERILYSARDRDLLIQRIANDHRGSKLHMIKTVEGRGPLCRLDGKIFMLTRDARDIKILDEEGYRCVGTIKGQDEWMINSLVCSPEGHRLYSGGYDRAITNYDSKAFTPLSRLDLGQTVVNCIGILPTDGSEQELFVGGNGGYLCKIIDS